MHPNRMFGGGLLGEAIDSLRKLIHRFPAPPYYQPLVVLVKTTKNKCRCSFKYKGTSDARDARHQTLTQVIHVFFVNQV
jgi:hypothetical protein